MVAITARRPTDKPVYLGRRAVIATIQGIAADDICSDVYVNTEVKPEPHNDVPTTLAEKTLIKRRWLRIW